MHSILPIPVGTLDHYTLIVEDAASVARFHSEVLGFEPLRVQLVNAGSVPEGEHDMLNHVLQLPGSSKRVMVVTEGLTPDSIFRRYLDRYGAGVHHVAYEVDDIEAARETLLSQGVGMTSETILRDPLTGLRQVFVDRSHGGYFIELIERTQTAAAGTFTSDNMAALARTMTSYLREGSGEETPPVGEPCVTIKAPRGEVLAFLLDPLMLPRWTGHRTVRRVEGRVVEVREHGDLALDVAHVDDAVVFTWRRDEQHLSVSFQVQSTPEGGTEVRVPLPPLTGSRLRRTARIIQIELGVLACLLEGRDEAISAEDREAIAEYHIEVYRRSNL
ncbi:MAG: methylmalonyl-CoA/ethylmalonyl-CoA epimerase [Myxococcota bacterium]|jgi:methylmalonyl-CoA/ethylmalonyl-CoA epimerase